MPTFMLRQKSAPLTVARRRTASEFGARGPIDDTQPAGRRARALTYPQTSRRVIVHAEDLDMSRAAKVISAAQKFILPIPPLSDGVPLVYPPGTRNSEGQLIEGQSITDWQGNPIGDTGVIFRNWKDQTVQAVQGDGTGVIIFNEATEGQAAALAAKVKALAGTVSALNHADIEAVLQSAADYGLIDRYNSDVGFIQSKMTPVGALGAEQFGLYKRDDRDICLAVRLDGRGAFKGPAATPQRYENGAVIVQQGNDFRLIQCDEFERTYRFADNTPIAARSLPRGLRD